MQGPSQLVVLTGPSGVGKGTLLRALCQRHPELQVSISATTRAPRAGEQDGKDYYFLDRTDFATKVAQGQFLEWAEYAGNCYGTLRDPVMDHIQQGKLVLLEIELEGARQVRQTADALQIFILPPSQTELEQRIRDRGQEDEAAIARRLERAQIEIEAAHEFDVQIVNDDFATALQALEEKLFPTSEECQRGGFKLG